MAYAAVGAGRDPAHCFAPGRKPTAPCAVHCQRPSHSTEPCLGSMSGYVPFLRVLCHRPPRNTLNAGRKHPYPHPHHRSASGTNRGLSVSSRHPLRSRSSSCLRASTDAIVEPSECRSDSRLQPTRWRARLSPSRRRCALPATVGPCGSFLTFEVIRDVIGPDIILLSLIYPLSACLDAII
jgi:hypothetical protein